MPWCVRARWSTPRNHHSKIVFPIAIVLFFVNGSFGQIDSAKANAAQTVHVNVDEVSLNLVVRGKKSRPVLNLKPEDIAVTDGGTPVKITSLRLAADASNSDHLLTFFFDRLDAASSHNARDIAEKILKAVPQTGFSFCVLRSEGRLKLYQDFTPDRSLLTHAIRLATTETGKALQTNDAELPEKRLIAVAKTGVDLSGTRVTTTQRTGAQVLLAALEDSQRVLQEQHSQPSLAGLLALARTERKLSGRKTVIFFSQGLQADSATADAFHSIIGAANRSGLSIYTIDANALSPQVSQSLMATSAIGNSMANQAMTHTPALSGLPQGIADITTAGMKSQASSQYERFETGDPNTRKGPLAELAESTGGAYIESDDNLSKPLHRMVEDLTTYYEASYISPIEAYDGQFRPIEVKAMRAGLKIQSRAGYYAIPPDSKSVIRPFEAPLLKVLGEAPLPSDLKFRTRVLRLGDLPSGNENVLVVEVPLAELQTRDDPNSNLYSLHASIVAQVKDKSGAVIEHFSEDVPRHGALDAKENARSEFITMQRHFLAEPGAYVVETAVLDQTSGKAGAQRVDCEITGAAGPSVSDVTMVQRVDPFPEEADPAEPLRYGSGKVVPGLSSRVAHGTKDLSFFFMVHPDPDSAEPPRLEMEVLRSNEFIAQVPLQLRNTSGPATIPYMASIQTGSLPSGDYEVVERLSQGGKTGERSVTFRIEGPELAGATAPANVDVAKSSARDAESATASDLQALDTGHNGRRLVITSLAPGAVPPPSADELQAIVAAARKHSLGYTKTLPNFICLEVTNRSVDASGNGVWKPRDSIAELLRYHDDQESRTTLEVNGKRSSISRADMKWALSVGEFGGLLKVVFNPDSKADFVWKEAGTLEGEAGNLQVLSYRVAREHANIAIGEGSEKLWVGFHGLVYIDSSTGGVRRVTAEADDLPRTFAIHAAAMTVDYSYVAIGTHDYLVPVRATVSRQRGRREIELNEIAFRNYRRFASQTKIKFLP